MITVKDYAAQNNVSFQAVYAQINRHSKVLGEHIIRQGRTMYLDDEAVRFLDARRDPTKKTTKRTVVIDHDEKDEKRIEELEAQLVEQKQKAAMQLLELRLEYQKNYEALQRENNTMIKVNADLMVELEKVRGASSVKDEQLTNLRERIAQDKDAYTLISDELKNKEIRISAQDRELEDLRKQLDAELNKGFFARLFRK